jgi:pilus assembly protein Flp/PilA
MESDMFRYAKTWLDMRFDRRGVTALEYGLLAAVVGTAIAAAATGLGTSLTTAFAAIAGKL